MKNEVRFGRKKEVADIKENENKGGKIRSASV
jgi:hypothetical protein